MVVVPAFMSLEVVEVKEEPIMASENVALMLAPGAIPLASAAGTVLVTLGDWVSRGVLSLRVKVLSLRPPASPTAMR